MSVPRKPSSPLFDALRVFSRNVPAVLALVMILGLAFAAITGSLFTGKQADASELIRMEESSLVGDNYRTEANPQSIKDPTTPELKDTFLPPFSHGRKDPDKYYILGSDHLGRDVFARLWAGSSISLTIGFLAVGISILLGISLGGIAGYFGRSRVGLPVLATLLLLLAGGVLIAAGLPTPGWVCAGVAGVLFIAQLALALVGGRHRSVVFFAAAAMLVVFSSAYNSDVESDTPEGMLYASAASTHGQAYALLLELRDYGQEVKAYEDSDQKNPQSITDQKDLPEWLYQGQLDYEVNFRLLAQQVEELEIVRFESANKQSLRMAVEQQERAERHQEFRQDFAERNAEALADEAAAITERDALFAAKKTDEGRKVAERAENHAARARTFDPVELDKRLKKLREVGAAREAFYTAFMGGVQEAVEARRTAIGACREALQKSLEAGASDPASMRLRQYEIETATRAYALALAQFGEASNTARLEAGKSVAAELEKNLGADKHEGLADIRRELDERTKQGEPLATALNDAKEAVENLRKIQHGESADKVGAERQLPPIKVQGSNDLIDRRGKLRKGFVTKYDTEMRNARTSLQTAVLPNGEYRYGLYRISSHFLTTTALLLLLIIAVLVVLAGAQAAAADRLPALKVFYVPTMTVDDLVMRFTEIMLTIPVIFLILAILAIFEKDVYITMGVIGLTSWMTTARFVRAEILSLREQDFVQSARALGLSDFRIIWRHLVPNAISPVLVSATLGVASAVLVESTLSFLGIGAKPDQTTWGMILSEGREYIFDASWLTWIPGVAILVTVLSFNLLGEGLREAFNPKLRGR